MLYKLSPAGSFFSLSGCALLFIMLFIACGVTMTPSTSYAAAANVSPPCAKDISFTNQKPGENIVKTVFATINTVMKKIGEAMYKGIVGNSSFQTVVKVTISLYVAIYGILVMLNLAPLRMGEVVGRLIRIAIIYGLLSFGASGWLMFDRYIGALFMGGMNELIFNFAVAAGVPVLPPVSVSSFGLSITPELNTSAVSALYTSMNIMYKPFYIFAVMGMLVLNLVSALMAIALVWAFWDFTMMILGALITYVRAVVGLTFLFGIAPIFIIFLLFSYTRGLFFGWVNQVVSFAIAPVLLFAFLAFYTVLLNNVLNGLFTNVNFCWGKAGSIPGTTTDINWWRPALFLNGSWVQVNGDWRDVKTLSPLPPPISVVSLLMFVMVCHLGKNFTNHINQLARNISDGVGPGIVTGGMAQGMLSKTASQLTGGRGFGGIFGTGGKNSPRGGGGGGGGTVARGPVGGGGTSGMSGGKPAGAGFNPTTKTSSAETAKAISKASPLPTGESARKSSDAIAKASPVSTKDSSKTTEAILALNPTPGTKR